MFVLLRSRSHRSVLSRERHRGSRVDRRSRSTRARDAQTLVRDKWSGRRQPFHFASVFLSEIFYIYVLLLILLFIY